MASTLNASNVKSILLEKVRSEIEKQAGFIVRQIQNDYQQVNSEIKGRADVDYKIQEYTEDEICLNVFGIGQRALIAEYGSGSKMDRDNPSLAQYLSDPIFNQERIKQNMAILTRPKDSSYYDLDGVLYVRKPPKNEINLENVNPKYKPVEAKHLIAKAIEQRLNYILRALQDVLISLPFEKMISGRTFKITL